MIIPQVKPGDWKQVQANFNRLSTVFMGTQSDPSISALVISSAAITNLTVSNFTGNAIVVTSAAISGASIDNLSVTSINAVGASISNLVVDTFVATSATVSALVATSADIGTIAITGGSFDTLSVNSATISALVASESTLSAVSIGSAIVSVLQVSSAVITSLSVASATISGLVATTANIVSARAGSSFNYVSLTSSGIQLVGDATVWDDLQVNINSAKIPASAYPNWDSVNGITSVLAFAGNQNNYITFTAQLPHSYKEGSDVEFHVHQSLPFISTGTVHWRLEYTWTSVGEAFVTTASLVSTTAAGSIDAHSLAVDSFLTGAGQSISSLLECKLTRLGSSDTYTGVAYVHAIDFHVERDTVGSDQELIK